MLIGLSVHRVWFIDISFVFFITAIKLLFFLPSKSAFFPRLIFVFFSSVLALPQALLTLVLLGSADELTNS